MGRRLKVEFSINEVMSWDQFEKACKLIVKKLKHRPVTGVYGIPRGGLVLAVRLSHLMNVDLITEKRLVTSSTLIVDDISDSGKTLTPWQWYISATLYYHKRSSVVPTVWIHEKTDKWIVFPWEIK